jgi:DNA gyrase/topoisomerase IV subunit A
MAVIRHFEANPEERAAYLKQRRLMAGVTEEPETDEEEAAPGDLSQERYAEMSAAEDLILTITRGGSGKLSSSHDYPVRGRGGQGVIAMDKAMRAARWWRVSRSRWRTRSCWRPPPGNRSACRSTVSPSALARRVA